MGYGLLMIYHYCIYLHFHFSLLLPCFIFPFTLKFIFLNLTFVSADPTLAIVLGIVVPVIVIGVIVGVLVFIKCRKRPKPETAERRLTMDEVK